MKSLLGVAYAGLLVSSATLSFEHLGGSGSQWFVVLLSVCTSSYLLVVAVQARRPDHPWLQPIPLVGMALVLRAMPLLAPPYLSDDVHRYLWEGHVQRHGFSPFAHAPDDPALRPLQNRDYERMNHPEVSAVYPPLAQWIFRFTPGGLIGWKLVLLGADLVIVALLLWLLRRRNEPVSRALLYAWHPLIVLEFTASAHLDLVAIAFLVLACAALASQRAAWGSFFVACAGLCKPPGLAAAASLCTRRRWPGLVVVALLFSLAWWPFARAGGHLLRGTREYARNWEFNGLLHPALTRLFAAAKEFLESLPGDFGMLHFLRETGYSIEPSQWSRRTSMLLFALLSLWLVRRLRHRPLHVAGALQVAFLATTATVHPWYGAWVIPFLPWIRSRALLLFTTTVLWGHFVKVQSQAQGAWWEPPWLGPVVWLVPCCLGAYELWRARGIRPADHSPAEGS